MIYSHEVEEMCTVNRGASHGWRIKKQENLINFGK